MIYVPEHPMSLEEAGEVAVWLAELFVHLTDTQVAEYPRIFAGHDRALIERAIREYARINQFCNLAALTDAIDDEIRKECHKREAELIDAKARAAAIERSMEREIDERIATMDPEDLAELHRATVGAWIANLPGGDKMRDRMLARPAASSALVRGHVRSIILEEKANERAKSRS